MRPSHTRFIALAAIACLALPSLSRAEKTLDFQSLLAAVAQRAVVNAQPSLPEPKVRRDPDARTGFYARPDSGSTVDFPLKHTKVYARVTGNVARVEVQQLYENPSDARLEAIYAFPLPANAAVTDMYFRIGNRVVYGEVKRKREARETYEQARAEGKTAALTEQERPNLFTQSVANIPPRQSVAVVLRYVHEVPFDDGRYLFVFPTTIGPRYIPGTPIGQQAGGRAADTDAVPDASRITPPVVTGGRSGHDVEILVRLSPGAAFHDVAAKSHRIVTGVDGDGGRLVGLAEDDRVPNKDFVLAYRPAGMQPEARALAQHEKGSDYMMLFVQPPAQVAEHHVRPKEMVFLVDKSGSMSGEPLETARGLILQALERMGPEDTFQLVAFDGAAYMMSPRPMANTAENVAAARHWLQTLEGGGGTEMLRGILTALTPPEDPNRLRMVVFCTDAFIGNEEQILRAIDENRGGARVFAFGIGSSVNRYLIEGMARVGRGASEIVLSGEGLDEAVARLYKRLDRPLLTDLELSFRGMEVTELYPERLPDLFAGQPLVVVGRYRRTDGPPAVELKGKLGTRPYRRELLLELQRAPEEQPVVGTLWARRKIDHLSFRNRHVQPEDVEAIAELGLRFKLVTAYTSFVAVEKELLADPGLPLTQVLMPNELPKGVSMKGIFGAGSGETEATVTPSRVKPGDPEIRVRAPLGTAAVEVTLPFDLQPRLALFDPATGEFVLRFLVPPAWPDGSYEAQLAITRADGEVERRGVAIRVDTTAAAVAVLSVTPHAKPGGTLDVVLKPALPLPTVADLIGKRTPGGFGMALKGAMEVKEILVRAPWGEIARARMQGPLGTYVAQLKVPADWSEGSVKLEIVASDTAGNVSRRPLEVRIGGPVAAGVELAVLVLLAAVAVAAAVAARRSSLRFAASQVRA